MTGDMLKRLAARPQAPLGQDRATPLDRAGRLSTDLGIDLWLKRDDLAGLGMGGNKVRQLAFYLGAARAEAADSILITGAVQSNFARTAAAAGARLGMSVHLQLEDRVPSDERVFGRLVRRGNPVLSAWRRRGRRRPRLGGLGG